MADKLFQVKADEARPRNERIAYGRRLMRLDPANKDCRRFVDSLLGLDETTESPAPKIAPTKRANPKVAPKPAKP